MGLVCVMCAVTAAHPLCEWKRQTVSLTSGAERICVYVFFFLRLRWTDRQLRGVRLLVLGLTADVGEETQLRPARHAPSQRSSWRGGYDGADGPGRTCTVLRVPE